MVVEQAGLLRRRGRDALRGRPAQRPHDLDRTALRLDQGGARLPARDPLRRRLRRLHERGQLAQRQDQVAVELAGARPGQRTDAFYSTPAVAFGRVYSGNNDHRVYSFQADDGTLAWSHSTGGYVYSGPDRRRHPHHRTDGLHRLGRRQRLRARREDGETRWSRSVGGESDRLAERGRQHRLRRRPTRRSRPTASRCATVARSSASEPAGPTRR